MPTTLSTIGVGLVERAVDLTIDHLKDQLNGFISLVYNDSPDKTINLPFVAPNRFYISEGIEPLQTPAVFVVADRTDHNLGAQNFEAQRHSILVGMLVEDVEVQRLQRKVWRYAKALWLALHDQALGDIKILVRSADYGPTLAAATPAGQRSFRKDVVLRCDVLHYERFR